MFGRGWEEGDATVIARRLHEGMYRGQAATGLYHSTYDYVVDVRPDSGALTFRATFTALFQSDMVTPNVGDEIRVKCNPEKQEAKLDKDPLREERKDQEQAVHDEFEAIAASGPGTPTPGTPAPPRPAVTEPDAAPAAPPAAHAPMPALDYLQAAMKAKAEGNEAEAARIIAEAKKAIGGQGS